MARQCPAGVFQFTGPAAILVRLMCCCMLLHQAGRRDVVCHLVGRGSKKTWAQSNVQFAQAEWEACLSQKIFHAHNLVTHTVFHTHNFVTRIFHTQLFTYDPPPPPLFFLPSPSRFNFCFCLLEEVDLWGLSGPLIFDVFLGDPRCSYAKH